MSHRRLAATAALVAAAVAMAPFTAHADSSSPHVIRSAASADSSTQARSASDATTHTFSSPATHSVRAVSSRTAVKPADSTLSVSLTGETTSAYGVELDSTVAGAAATQALTVTVAWGDGTTTNTTTTGPSTVKSPHSYAKAGAYHITVTVTDGTTTASNSVNAWTAGTSYTAYGPTRLLDTRYGTGAAKAKVPAQGTIRLKIGGTGTIPGDVGAAVLNLTVTNSTRGGFLTAYPDGEARPTSSNVNFVAGHTAANLGLVPVGADGYVDLYNSSPAPVDMVADINGYFGWQSSAYYTSLTPFRLADTRYGVGTPKKQIAPKTSIALTVAGAGHGLPSSGVSAVALNITATNAKTNGVITVYPDGATRPTTSNVNFVAGQNIANAAVTPVGADGKIRVYVMSGAPMDVIVDVVGYYSSTAKGAYIPVTPTRWLDTRTAAWGAGPLPPRYWIEMGTYQDAGVKAVVLNTTVTNTKGNGWLGITPDPNSQDAYNNDTYVDPADPVSSTLNWVHGQTVPNLAQATTGPYSLIDLWNESSGNLDLVVDCFGLYMDK